MVGVLVSCNLVRILVGRHEEFELTGSLDGICAYSSNSCGSDGEN
jgi:hypothetical protein